MYPTSPLWELPSFMSSDQMTIYENLLLSKGFTPAQVKEIRTAYYKAFHPPLHK